MRRNPIRWWNPLTTRPPGRRRETFARPELECLEDRIVPAHNLAIDYVDTSGVSQTDDYSIRTFTATTDDAVLNVADIQAAFDAGFDVVISTGEGGSSTGNIVWREGADAYFTGSSEFPSFHSLTLQTDSDDSDRNVEIQAGIFGNVSNSSPFFTLSILTGGSSGAVTLHQVEVAGGPLTVAAGDAGIFLYDNLTTHGGDLTLTGNVLLQSSVNLTTTADNFGFPPAITAANSASSFSTSGSVFVSGTVDGDGEPRDLRILADNGTINLDGDLGGVQQKLGNLYITGNLNLAGDRIVTVQSQFTLVAGMLDLGSHALTVSTGLFAIGDGSTDAWATLAGTGTLHADMPVQVAANGVISPGGLRNVGALQIVGSVEFLAGSHLVVDLADTPDNLHVTGSVQLNAGALLYGGSGLLNGPGPFQIVTADGGLTGQGVFANTNVPIGLADDVVKVSYTADAVLLQPVAPGGTQVGGAAPDGTLYTIKLTSGGNARLQTFDSFNVGSVSEYKTVAKHVPYTYTVSVSVTKVVRNRTVAYETVPVDTDTSTVYVTIPVEREIETEVTEFVLEQRTATRTVYESEAFQKDAFVRTFDIRVQGSTAANQLRITTTANGGSGRLDVGRIVVSGALGALVAPTTSLGSLQVDRYLGRVRLAQLSGPMIAGGNRARQTSIAIGRIDGDITTGSAIASLTSNQVGQHTITAPRIGRLLINGDFNASLVLDAGFRSAVALGFVSIAGGMSNTIWDIRGSVGTVTVNGAIEGWSFGYTDRLGNIDSLKVGNVHESSIGSTGRINTLTAVGWQGSQIVANTIGTLTVTGNFSTDLVLDAGLSTARALGTATVGSIAGTWDMCGSLGAITVKKKVDGWNLGTTYGEHGQQLGSIQALQLGQVTGLGINATGRIGALSAVFAASAYSYIHARSIGTLNARGTFTGSLVLDAGDETAMALASAHFTRIRNSFWDIRGSLGEVTVDGSASNWGLGGNDQLGNIRKLKIGGTLNGSGINAVGRIGSLQAAQWQITDVRARSLGSLTVTGGKPGGLPGDFLFSTVTLTGASRHVGLGTANIRGRVYGSTFNVMAGDVTTFTCGRFEHSRLFVGYVPVDPENFSLTGNFVDAFTLGTFTTTVTPLVPGQSDPRTDAFTGSQIVANRFGRVNLTSMRIQNEGTAFGLRVNGAANAGKVRINTAPFNSNVDIQPGTTRVDFQFLAS